MDQNYRYRTCSHRILARSGVFCPQTKSLSQPLNSFGSPSPTKLKNPKRGAMRSLCLGLLLLGAADAHAFVRTVAETGSPLVWPNPAISLQLNPNNSSGLSAASVTAMISGAFQAWANAGSSVSFGMNSSTGNATSSSQDFASRVFFTSNSSSKFYINF